MPLKPGASRTVIGQNIGELIASGRPQAQAVAISLDTARKTGGTAPRKPKVRR